MSKRYLLLTIEDYEPKITVHPNLKHAQDAMRDAAHHEWVNYNMETKRNTWAKVLQQLASTGEYDDEKFLFLNAWAGGLYTEGPNDTPTSWFICSIPNEMTTGTILDTIAAQEAGTWPVPTSP